MKPIKSQHEREKKHKLRLLPDANVFHMVKNKSNRGESGKIEKEIQALLRPQRPMDNPGHPVSKTIITHQNRHFVKAFNIHSILENYEVINAYDYKRRRKEFLRKYQLTRAIDGILLDDTLKTILFQVMPYFIRKNRGMCRKKLKDEEILDLIV